MALKIVIIGAGPSGMLLAHYLLRRSQPYQIDIYDRLGDPRAPLNFQMPEPTPSP